MNKQADSPDDQSQPLSTDSKGEEHLIENFANFIIENLKENYESDWEPFEVYAYKLRSHVHADLQIFRKRFLQGYESLLEVIGESRLP